MTKEQVAWVSLEDVMAAAERGLAPLGPELAGFVVLEAAARARELGGVVDVSRLAIGTSGHVALTAPPRAGDETAATIALRGTLSELLAVASATTPALRACAKRREGMSLGMLARELESGLIPLNRAASRRGVARVARATLEAIAVGALPEEQEPREPPATTETERAEAPEVRPQIEAPEPPAKDEEATPYVASILRPTGTPPLALVDLPPELEDEDDADIEIVSNLPPLVAESQKPDRVAALVAAFEVSRRRDDPTLARDLKAMVGIETSMPPAVTVNVRLREPKVVIEEIAIDHEPLVDEPATHTPIPPRPRKNGSFVAFFAIAAIGAGVVCVVRPTVLDTLMGAPATPPGDDKGTTAATITAKPTIKPVATCEATLVVENVPAGAEVLRRLGTMPMSVTLPARAPLDLVATLDGAAPRRIHLDEKARWQSDATGLHLDVPFALEVSPGFSESKWPTATAPSPLRPSDVRGLLRASSRPAGATLWATVEPAAIAVPCGGAVDLTIVTGATQRPLHVEWNAFTGSPPRATTKL